jgi:hypothetical protein
MSEQEHEETGSRDEQDRAEIEALTGWKAPTRMGWDEDSGPELPGSTYASTTNWEYQDILRGWRDQIESYKLAKNPRVAYLSEDGDPVLYHKADPIELAIIEHAIPLLEDFLVKAERIFRLGARSKSVSAIPRCCPDCPPEDRVPLPPRWQCCAKHRDERRKSTHRKYNRNRKQTTVTTVSPLLLGGNGIKNPQENSEPVGLTLVDKIKREIVRLMNDEKLSPYRAAEKLGIVKEQVNRWRLRDKEFRLMLRVENALKIIELVLEAKDLKGTTGPLTEQEKLKVWVAEQYVSSGVANHIVRLGLLAGEGKEPELRRLSIREMREVDNMSSELRKLDRQLDDELAKIKRKSLKTR